MEREREEKIWKCTEREKYIERVNRKKNRRKLWTKKRKYYIIVN